jgi:hypothetical protein
MKSHRYATTLALCGALAVAAVSVAAASPSASKQRIAIDAKGSQLAPEATFVLTTSSRGGLEADVGSGVNTGQPRAIVVERTGQSTRKVAFVNSLRGKNGTFKVTGLVTSASAGNGYGSDHGTWTFRGLTGAYAGYSGGGGVALVSLPTGKLIYRLEGYVSKR